MPQCFAGHALYLRNGRTKHWRHTAGQSKSLHARIWLQRTRRLGVDFGVDILMKQHSQLGILGTQGVSLCEQVRTTL